MKQVVLNIIFFVIMSIVITLLLHLTFKYYFLKKDNKKNTKLYYCYAVVFVLLLTVVAVLRKVDVGIGGADAQNYIDHFRNKTAIINWVKKGEFIFAYFTAFIRLFTNDYRIYFFVIYATMALSYLIFIKTYTSKNVSYIPMLALIYFYLLSFSIIRTVFAIAIFLLGLSLFKKHKIWGSLVIASTIFIHRASVFAVGVILFYFIYKKWLSKLKWKQQIVLFTILSIVLSLLAFGIKEILISSNYITPADKNYIKVANERTALNVLNLGLTSLLLFIAMAISDKNVDKNENYEFLKIINLYCFIFVYPLIILGIFRFTEYFYIARLLMWGILIVSIYNNYLKSYKLKKLFIFIVVVLFIAFVVYRLYRSINFDNFILYKFFINT